MALSRLGHAAIPALRQAVASAGDDADWRLTLVEALRRLRTPRAAHVLREMLDDPAPRVRHAATLALHDRGVSVNSEQ